MNTDPSDFNTEGASSLLGSYNISSSDYISVRVVDFDDDNRLDQDDGQSGFSDRFDSYIRPGETSSSFGEVSIHARYDVLVNYADGTSSTGSVFVVQLRNGDTFITSGGDFDDNSLVGLLEGGSSGDSSVTSITFQSVSFPDAEGEYAAGPLVIDQHLPGIDFPCFTSGTLILTEDGEVPVESLTTGTKILTMDNGYCEIVWIGRRKFSSEQLSKDDKVRPIRIAAGAIGGDVPVKDLIVSPQHRIFIQSKIAKRLFGTEEVLVAAKHLLALDGIDIVNDDRDVEYIHFMFSDHQIVYSNGCATESLYCGQQSRDFLCREYSEEISTVFPELLSNDVVHTPARFILNGRLGRKLAARHQKNKRALADPCFVP